MKKNNKKNEYSGIRVTDNISFIVPKRNNYLNTISVMCVAFLGLIGIVFSFMTMFNIAVSDWKLILTYTVFFSVLFSVIYIIPGKFRLGLIPIFLLYCFIVYRNWADIVYGFMVVSNKIYSIIKPKKPECFKLDTALISEDEAVVLFLVTAIFVIAAIIGYATVLRPNFFISFFVSFPFLELGWYFGQAPKHIFAFMVIIYWVCMIVLQNSGYRQRKKSKTAGFYRKGSHFSAKPGVRFSTAGTSCFMILMVSVIIISLTSAVLNMTDYKRSEKLNITRNNMKEAVSQFTFDDLGASIKRFSTVIGMGEYRSYSHKLGNLKSITFDNKTDLIVKSSAYSENNIYMKGYAGSVYDGKSWNSFNNSVYEEYEEMFSMCRESGEYPQNMINKYVTDGDTAKISVNTKYKNERYNYVPYGSSPRGKITYIYDTVIELENKNQYEFITPLHQRFEYLFENADSEVLNEFENQYTEFVYDNYLSVPENAEMEQLRELLPAQEYSSDLQKLNFIKSVLAENAEYSLEPGKTPSNRDFVNYFLLENHKGYCVHFATSGVILARMMGIPARYADGYVISREDFSDSNKQPDGTYKIEIKDNRAHAWAEIYITGKGWVPFEFTPSSAAAFSLSEETDATTPDLNLPVSSETTATEETDITVQSDTLTETTSASGETKA
ncbi:MAG: transglutaminase-like domain-containing protein, partial [Oscillospiraceae bacterium]|nr:transglutaminase-like domain-containing protein [Oscillospiraceae bacterium]